MTARALEVELGVIAIGARALMRDLEFRVEPGSATTIMGPSGAGKSTLLAYIGGHLDPAFRASGRVTLDGSDVAALPPERRAIGVLFQDDLLFPHLSVGANIAFGLDPKVRGRAARRARVEAALAEAGLAGFAKRDPATLSGGQRARVALMRTLVAAPKALLLDDPFAKLDHALRREFQRFVFFEAARRGLPVLLVTHDPADAEAAGGPILRLDEFGAATMGA